MSGPVVGQQDITEMQKLLNIMNGVAPAMPGPAGTSNVAQKAQPVEVQYSGPTAPDSNDMKRILESFYGAAGEAVESLNERAAVTSQIAEAMQTTRTDEGVLIGRWEVRVRVAESATSGATRKLYDVINPSTRAVVADRLYVYEAAHAVVRYLNKGLDLEHRKVQEVLDLEETFRRNRQDAARFKQRFDRCMQLGEQQAADVFESRYQVARANALAASDSIKSILDNIR